MQTILAMALVGFAVFAVTKVIDNSNLEDLNIKHSSELARKHNHIISLEKKIVMQSDEIQLLKQEKAELNDINDSLLSLISENKSSSTLLPSGMTNTIRYMDYHKITDKSTHQYLLQQECETGVSTGIRLYYDTFEDVYYCVALAKAYGQTIGDAWRVTLQNGEDFNIILAECKGNDAGYFGHDDENYDGQKCINILEFVVDETVMPYEVKDKGTFTVLKSFGGLYGNGGNIKSMEYLGRIWEPEGGTK